MSFVEDVLKGRSIGTGLAIGVGALILAPVVVAIAKPLAKMAVRGGAALYKVGRDAASEASKTVSEAKAELHRGTEGS